MKTRDYYWQVQLVAKDGRPFIRWDNPRSNEPINDIFYWEVTRATQFFDLAELPLPAHDNRDSISSYTVRRERDLDKTSIGYDAHFSVYLKDGGQTKAEFVEHEPIPQPKCRTELRWHNGRWEKYMKREGWIVA